MIQPATVLQAYPDRSPVVVLRNQPHWEAPKSFAAELGRSLARQSGCETLVVNLAALYGCQIGRLLIHPALLRFEKKEERVTA